MQLNPFKLERYFARYEFNTQYLLCSSDSQSLSVQDLLALEPDAAERFHQHWLGYTESLGAPSLRQEISRIYTAIQPEQVLVHSGAEEGIFLFMLAALQPGDHVIVHSPGYQSLAEVARSLGCEVTAWLAREENDWMPDLDELKRSLRPYHAGGGDQHTPQPNRAVNDSPEFRAGQPLHPGAWPAVFLGRGLPRV